MHEQTKEITELILKAKEKKNFHFQKSLGLIEPAAGRKFLK